MNNINKSLNDNALMTTEEENGVDIRNIDDYNGSGYNTLTDSSIELNNETPRPLRFTYNRSNSVILPLTGERVKRSILFFNTISDGDSPITERSSLLPLRNMGRNLVEPYSSVRIFCTKVKEAYFSRSVRDVIKCTLAYYVASLGVYYTPFDRILGSSDSKHILATVAVYFHPARSKGSMYQTLSFVLLSLLFTFLVTFSCRSVSSFFFNMGNDGISNTIDLLVSSTALGFIAYMKQKVSKQNFNTACSLASISVIACIVKEGSLNTSDIPIERLVSTLHIVFAGCLVTFFICFFLWPVSAVDELRAHLNDSYDIMSSLLSITASRFLCGERFRAKDLEFVTALRKNVKLLSTSLEETSYELRMKGREAELFIFEKLVSSTISLLNNLQALGSSTEMRWHQTLHAAETQCADSVSGSSLDSYDSNICLSHSIDNLSMIKSDQSSVIEDESDNLDYLFQLFVKSLAPSIKSFIFTVKSVLSEVPFEDENNPKNFTDSTQFQDSLSSALHLFNEKQEEAFEKLYTQDVLQLSINRLEASEEEVIACCGNFSSLLGFFTEELIEFLKLSEEYEYARLSPRTWNWLKFWKKKPQAGTRKAFVVGEDGIERALSYFRSKYGTYLNNNDANHDNSNVVSFKIWKYLQVFKRIDVQFGIRVGLGALALSFFAFYDKSKNFFINWRGEWAIVVYCIMMNKSLGGTTMTVKWRFIGTFLGAFTAYVVWMLTNGNVYALSTTGFLLCLPCFYIILFWKRNNPFGRFILLTYNLTALYSYSMSQKESEDGNEGGDKPLVGDIALHRFIAVSIGIIWALTMASCFLPNSARTRLKNALVILWLRMGLIWNSDPLEYEMNVDSEGATLKGLKNDKGNYTLIFECETLLKQAPLELRLKGNFPSGIYEKLLQSTSTILDAYHNMNLMIGMDPTISYGEEFVLNYVQSERKELESRIFVIFYVIASSIKLNLPIPRKPVSTEHARERFLHKLNEVRRNSIRDSSIKLRNEDYVFLYSYILVTSIIVTELNKMVNLLQQLLGDISYDTFNLV